MYLLENYNKGRVLDFHNKSEVIYNRGVSINKLNIEITQLGNYIKKAKYDKCFESVNLLWDKLKLIISENEYDKIYCVSNRDSKSILITSLIKLIKENLNHGYVKTAFEWINYDFFRKGVNKSEIDINTKDINEISNKNYKIMILDDIFYSGSTLYLAFSILRKKYPNAQFYLICLTKVKSDGVEIYFDKNAVQQCI